MYKAQGHRLYVVVAPESWKARHIALHENVAMTVPVRRVVDYCRSSSPSLRRRSASMAKRWFTPATCRR